MSGPGQLTLFDAGGGGPAVGVRTSRRARRLTLRVYPGGRVEVTVPQGTGPSVVQRFVSRHRAWIDARVLELRTRTTPAQQPLPLRLALQAAGDDWAIAYRSTGRGGWRVTAPQRLEVHAGPADTPRAQRALRAFLVAEARRTLVPWLTEVGAECGLSFRQVQLRRQRTRWGSCSRRGTISLNVCLLFQPPAVVRYLLIHELCHTREMNHSPRFWTLVGRHEPDWKSLDGELTRGWRHVPDWVFG